MGVGHWNINSVIRQAAFVPRLKEMRGPAVDIWGQ